MKYLKNLIINNWFILVFIFIFFCYALFNFFQFGPHHDQAFHITWFQNIKFSDHLIAPNFFIDYKYLLTDENGFFHELLKPANNPKDYHAYLFQINSVLIIYLISFLLNLNPIELYNVISIFFSSLSIFVNYKILELILKENKIFVNKKINIFIYQLIFCVLSFTYYKYYFSPLGHHNIGYFFFSFVIFLFLKNFNKNINSNIYKISIFTSISSYFQITVGLLLLPFFSLIILLKKFRIDFLNIKNFAKFIFMTAILLSPFLILLIRNYINAGDDFFDNLLGKKNFEISFYYEKIFFWFKKLFILSSPIVFIGFILSFFVCYKLKKISILYLIIGIHFIINIILSIFYISYLRNFFYIYNIILILSAFTFIYFVSFKNSILKILVSCLILVSFFYNSNIIFNIDNLKKTEKLFFQIYFENQSTIKNQIYNSKLLMNNNKIIFFSDLSKNYFSAYDYSFVEKNSLSKKPLLNLSKHINNDNFYSKQLIRNYNQLNNDFIMISIGEGFSTQRKTFLELKNFNLISNKCEIFFPHLKNELIFPDATSGEYNINLYLTRIKC